LGQFLSSDLLLFIGLGFIAQLVDGALGMAYGVIATTVLLSLGTPPAFASASVHAAEIVTTGLAGASHVWHRNIDWALFRKLAPAGIAGGVIGAYVLVGLPETLIRFLVTLYLMAIAALIARRILRGRPAEEHTKSERERRLPTVPLGTAGGFLDAVGGGGWGPLVASSLLARGDHPRTSIGSASLAEFFLTLSISIAFVTALDVSQFWREVVGLIIGGAIAAPFAGLFSRLLRPRTLMILVAIVIVGLCVYNLSRLGLELHRNAAWGVAAIVAGRSA